MAVLLLEGPPLARVRCPLCAGRGLVALTAYRMPRECPTCRGLGLAVIDNRFADGIELRAYQLGLHSRPASPQITPEIQHKDETDG